MTGAKATFFIPLSVIGFITLVVTSGVFTISTAYEVKQLREDLKAANQNVSKELEEIKNYARGLDELAEKWRR